MMNRISPSAFTVALLADIHANLAALDAVLVSLATQRYDRLVIAGDLISQGPQPTETLARIRSLDATTILGNGDRAIVEALANNATTITGWARQQIDESGVDYLATLPLSHRITPPQGNTPEDDLLIVHATPTSLVDILVLEHRPPSRSYERVTPERTARLMLGGERANLIVYGHIHYTSSGTVSGQRLASIGSVGFPFDGDPRAAYAFALWDGTQWQIRHHRTPYDYQRTIAAVYASGQPNADLYANRLRTAMWWP